MKPTIEIPTFLKWAGGKRRLLSLIEKSFPKTIDNYFEPFLGGGSVFFYVKQKYNPKKCVISDINQDLVNTYLTVRDAPSELVAVLKKLKRIHSEENYYKVRERFNSDGYDLVSRSAVFIYLNKTCFNGLYRVNKSNEFNVPFGKYKDPKIFDEKVIYRASSILKDGVEILNCDYNKIADRIRTSDFVYLDPCYDPIKKTSFTSYTPEKFSEKDRVRLYEFIENLRQQEVQVVLSNNDIPEVRTLYSEYELISFLAPRYIGSRTNYRADVRELVIRTPNLNL